MAYYTFVILSSYRNTLIRSIDEGGVGGSRPAIDVATQVQYHDIMMKRHDKRRRGVAEPVQVYLDSAERARLERLTAQLDATKSDVLRQGLGALERQLTDPASHPALRIIGIAAGYPRRPSVGYDVAREHDRFLAESERASWKSPVEGTDGP